MMYLETIKSFILWILVGISLLLTYVLWSYQPELETLDQGFEDRVDIGGREKSIQELIEPESIIFKNSDSYYGFTDPGNYRSLYQDMQQKWVLYEFQTGPSNGRPSIEKQVEIIFPDVIPLSAAKSLFSFNEDVTFPGWSFERIFITFNTDSNTLNFIFLSADGQRQATAVVNNSNRFAQLWGYLTTFEGLTEYLQIDGAEGPIFIPKFQVEIQSRLVAINTISPYQMVDELFRNPDLVSDNRVNENEVYFTDSQRGIMRVYENRRTLEFQNPLESTYERMSSSDLIERSITHINEHRGFTDEYNLMALNTTSNTIKYQMYYDGYPVFGNNNSSVIEQQYRSLELHQYNRPLFRLNNYLGGKTEILPSGSDVRYILENSKTYDMSNVNDIKVGYQLSYRSSDNAIELEPAWFMDYNGSWREINFEEITQLEGGG
ncbi:YycH family regulatory protein [Virgibacillus doumboii]|uniref:YycH family regulatory protein n=1 Tax=Virgibacillus doumboii TaxID=2697503 RepID=UPI0013E02627|nr:two-component system activity regulator YycH [Virgibacillus doumboii]